MAGLDYQYGPEFDYFDRLLPYEIPGEIPTYDPSLYKTARMRAYHDRFPQNDSSQNELAEIKKRLGRVTSITKDDEPPQENLSNIIQSLYSGAQTGIGEVGDFIQWLGDALNPALATEEGRKAQAEHKQRAAESLAPNPEPRGMYDQLRNAALLVAMMETGGATRAASIGKTIPAATETMAAKAPVGGNVWPELRKRAKNLGRVTSPGDVRESPEILNKIRAENLRARGAQTSGNDALEDVMSNAKSADEIRAIQDNAWNNKYTPGPGTTGRTTAYDPEAQKLMEYLESAAPEESTFAKAIRQDPGQSFNATEFIESPEITGTGLNYRIDRQGRRRVIPDEGFRGEYSQYTGPTKNTDGFWEDVTSPSRRAYDLINNDLGEVVNALLRAPGEIMNYGKDVARGVGYGLKEGGRAAVQDAIQNESPALHRIADMVQTATKLGRKARILDEEPSYYVPKREGGWSQGNWSDALPSEMKGIYNTAPKDSLQRKAIALQERDLPAFSDFIDRHPVATIGGAGLLSADTLARLGGPILGYETPSKWEGLKTAADLLMPRTKQGASEPWYAAYDWLWGG